MYSITKIHKGIKNPRRALWELGWQLNRQVLGNGGISIMEADWDNLIILDACRYDLFKEINCIKGELKPVISKGSSTSEFLQRNFGVSVKEFRDTVYISANPQVDNNGVENRFYDYIPLWDSEWDEKLNTVHPKDATDCTIDLLELYENKRLIVHYIQPHYPFIGERGKTINHRSLHGGGTKSDPAQMENSVWEKLRDGEIGKATVWRAYQENLELAMPHVRRLVKELIGKTVITSDHGNAFGRYGVYGHPSKFYLKELVKVPWLEIDTTSRKTIQADEALKKTDPDDVVEERLSQLGYK